VQLGVAGVKDVAGHRRHTVLVAQCLSKAATSSRATSCGG
jgi:hypothetical protein